MIPPPIKLAALLLAAAATLPGQNPAISVPAPTRPAPKPAIPYVNRNLVFLDPAHGGPDAGAHINDHTLEKDVTLALATRIRTLLAAENLSVLLAREADSPVLAPSDTDQPATIIPTPTPDQRAGAANHVHPFACILLHATASGNGVHIVTSPLIPVEQSLDPAPAARAIPWDTAQTDSVPQSLRLANEIGTALARARLPVHLSRASVRPIDSLTCPAVAIEIAPLLSGPTPVSDPVYQQRVAEAVSTALLFWRAHADPPAPTSASPGLPAPHTGGAQP